MRPHVHIVVSIGVIGLLLAGTMTPVLPALAQSAVRVFVDGDRVAFDQPPLTLGGRVLVPLRGVFERMGATVDWEPATRTVLAVRGNTVIELVIGRRAVQVNNRVVALDVPAMIAGGRTLVPLRFVSEALGATVEWQEETRTVLISTGSPPAGQPPASAPPPPGPPPAQVLTGTLAEIRTGDNPSIGVERRAPANTLTRIPITPETTITRVNLTTNSGGSVSLNALKIGDEVDVKLGSNHQAERIRATFKIVLGRFNTLASQGRAIVLTDGNVHRLAEDNVEVIINDKPSAVANLRSGMVVTLRLNPTTNLVYGVTAETVSGQEPPTRPARPTLASPASGAVIASPVEVSGMAEGAARVVITIDALLGVRLAAREAEVGRRGRFEVPLNYQQVFSGWPIVVTVVAVNRAGLESDPATVTVRQR